MRDAHARSVPYWLYAHKVIVLKLPRPRIVSIKFVSIEVELRKRMHAVNNYMKPTMF